MAKPAIADVADALVAALNAATFSLPFTAERSYEASYGEEDLSALKVTVTPVERATTREDRARNANLHTVLVAFQKQVDAESNAQLNDLVDPLAYLVEEVADWLDKREVTAGGVPCKPPAPPVIRPVADFRQLDEDRVFSSAIEVAFRERRLP